MENSILPGQSLEKKYTVFLFIILSYSTISKPKPPDYLRYLCNMQKLALKLVTRNTHRSLLFNPKLFDTFYITCLLLSNAFKHYSALFCKCHLSLIFNKNIGLGIYIISDGNKSQKRRIAYTKKCHHNIEKCFEF